MVPRVPVGFGLSVRRGRTVAIAAALLAGLLAAGCGSSHGGEPSAKGGGSSGGVTGSSSGAGSSGGSGGGSGGGSTYDGSFVLAGDGGSAPPCSLPISASDHAARLATLGSSIDTLVTKFEHDFPPSGGSIGCPAVGASTNATHNWADYAFAKITRGTDAAGTALALSAVTCMFKYQDVTPSSSTYGVFRFHVDNSPNPSDNSTEFALYSVGWLLTQGKIPASMLTTLAPQIRAGLDAIDAHEVCPSYTNVCLLQQADRLSIGAAFAASSNPTLKADGATRIAKAKTELDAWAASVHAGGIREFDSPTYAEIDFENLLLAHAGATLAGDTAAIARVEGALDYLWADFAANVFVSRGNLAPPFSRTYDFFDGQGIFEYAPWLEGLTAQPPAATVALQQVTTPMTAWLTTGASGGYRPPGSSLCWNEQPSRDVISEFQQNGRTPMGRHAYVTGDFSVGSATADFPVGSNIDIDLLFGASVASTHDTPLLSVLPDWLDAPGTAISAGDFTKVAHLPLDPAVVQNQGAALLLARIPASDPGYTSPSGGHIPLVNLSTNLIAPAKVDAVIVDGTKIDPTKSGTATARPTLVVQNMTGVVGFAVLDASGLDCVGSSGAITETGSAHVDVLPVTPPTGDPAVRLAIRHLDTPPSSTSSLDACFARVAILLVGRHCDSASCGTSLASDLASAVTGAQTSFQASSGDWKVTVQAPGGSMLHIERGTAKPATITSITIDGATPKYVPLAVNGTELTLLP